MSIETKHILKVLLIGDKGIDPALLQAHGMKGDIESGNGSVHADIFEVNSRKTNLLGVQDQIARHLMHAEYSAVLVPNRLRVSNPGIAEAVRAQHLGNIYLYGGPEMTYTLVSPPYAGTIDISWLLESKGLVRQQLVGLLPELVSQ